MFLRFEENPNCGFVDDRVWKHAGEPRAVSEVMCQRGGETLWCAVAGLNERGEPVAAHGVKVEDSGEGTCWLICGDLWGLRLKPVDHSAPWSLDDPLQWGEGFLLLPANGQDLHFTLV